MIVWYSIFHICLGVLFVRLAGWAHTEEPDNVPALTRVNRIMLTLFWPIIVVGSVFKWVFG